MITPSFSPTATERVLPKLALDFTTASLDPRVTFTRTTNATNPATYIDSNGLVASATNNQPRFDYTLNTGGSCKGLLIEEARTNAIQYSNDFTATGWTKAILGAGSLPVVTANSGTSPDGTNNAWKVTFNSPASGDGSILRYPISITPVAYAGSFFVKAFDSADVGKTIAFRHAGGGAYTITTLTNTWQRVEKVETGFGTASDYFQILTRYGITSSGVVNILLYGAQFETGAFATSYIPTSAGTATRNADVATMTGTNFSDWYNASEGTVIAKANSVVGSNSRIWSISNGTSAARINNYVSSSTNVNFVVTVFGSNTNVIGMPVTATTSTNTYASAYKVDSFAGAANGAAAVTNSSGALPGVTLLRFGMDEVGTTTAAMLNGCFAKFYYYKQRLTNAEVQAFSKG